MLQSMTGYSRATRPSPQGTITVEIRSTNHRYLEVDLRGPDGLGGYEGEVVQLVRKSIRRGRIEVAVMVQPPKAERRKIQIDQVLAQDYYDALLELKGRFGLKGDVTLDHLLAQPILPNGRDERSRRQELWPEIRQAIQAAVKNLVAMRQSEGQRLAKDIRAQAKLIGKHAQAVRRKLPKNMALQKTRLGERLKSVIGGSASMGPGQIHEALLLLKDVDVHEELIRLQSHLQHMEQALGSSEIIGKKLDFIGQELMREANTMGAKANDGELVRHCIEIKGAIEKIREQAQNLE